MCGWIIRLDEAGHAVEEREAGCLSTGSGIRQRSIVLFEQSKKGRAAANEGNQGRVSGWAGKRGSDEMGKSRGRLPSYGIFESPP
jgi:hypothetical protein